jgi:hypothetical protein
MADRGFGCFFGRMKDRKCNAILPEYARNVTPSRLFMTPLDNGSGAGISWTRRSNSDVMKEVK